MNFASMEERWKQVVFALIVLAIAFVISLITKYAIGRFVRIASSKLKVNPTKYKFFKNGVDFIIYLLAFIIIFKSIPELESFGNGLLASAGVLAAIVGFASQSAFSNIVSGIFLVIFRPFSVGDRVKIGDRYHGDVEDITLRHTVIRDFENRMIIFPNTVIGNEVIINATTEDERVCMFIDVNISFKCNIDKAMEIIRAEALQHPYIIDARTAEEKRNHEPSVMVRVINIAEYAVQLRGYAWAKDPHSGFVLKCDLLKAVKERFDKEGIEIPYPHHQVLMNNFHEQA